MEADQNNEKKYFECSNGWEYHRQCANDEIFDKSENVCTSSTTVDGLVIDSTTSSVEDKK